MNILFDFITLYQPTGAGEYIRRVFQEFLIAIKNNQQKYSVFALWDSSRGIYYDDMTESNLSCYGVNYVDISSYNNIVSAIEENEIDVFFIACAQYIGKYKDVEKIKCRVVCVIHDLSYEENYYNNIQPFQALSYKFFRQDKIEKPLGWKLLLNFKCPTLRFCRWYYAVRSAGNWEKELTWMQNIIGLVNANDDVALIAVSEYTKNSIVYNFHINPDRIHVCYSPERVFLKSDEIENEELRNIIEHKKKYYLIVSAGRLEKNAYKAVMAFKRFALEDPESYLLTLGFKEKLFENHIDLEFLSDSDLELCYSNCYAMIYPSIFEGFGYPPIEAMRFSKPILCSNVCSMPEILGNAPIYFSPIYQSDIYMALTKLSKENYNHYSQESSNQYAKIQMRQKKDLNDLIYMLLNYE